MAPEVLNMKKDMTADILGNSDIYSAGIIFYFLLSGILPFGAQGFAATVQKNKLGKINFLIPELRNIPIQTTSLLQRMLHPDPKLRITPEEALTHSYFRLPSNLTQSQVNTNVNQDAEPNWTKLNNLTQETCIDIQKQLNKYQTRPKISPNFHRESIKPDNKPQFDFRKQSTTSNLTNSPNLLEKEEI
jgi:serine/threonine protein kinase